MPRRRSPQRKLERSAPRYATGDGRATLPAARADQSDRPLGPANTNAHNITQIAEGLAGSARPDEIVNAIFELRPSFPLAELAELLDRAKDFQFQAEALQHKAATLMDVVEQIANSVRYDRGS